MSVAPVPCSRNEELIDGFRHHRNCPCVNAKTYISFPVERRSRRVGVLHRIKKVSHGFMCFLHWTMWLQSSKHIQNHAARHIVPKQANTPSKTSNAPKVVDNRTSVLAISSHSRSTPRQTEGRRVGVKEAENFWAPKQAKRGPQQSTSHCPGYEDHRDEASLRNHFVYGSCMLTSLLLWKQVFYKTLEHLNTMINQTMINSTFILKEINNSSISHCPSPTPSTLVHSLVLPLALAVSQLLRSITLLERLRTTMLWLGFDLLHSHVPWWHALQVHPDFWSKTASVGAGCPAAASTRSPRCFTEANVQLSAGNAPLLQVYHRT